MTTTATPPPPFNPSPGGEDIPGVTRRHRFSDFYHERTNLQFIKHSRRWLILSTTFMVLAVLLVLVRGINFGIDFEGGTAWQVKMTGNKSAKVSEVRDIIRPLGFSDAKVSVLTGQGQSVRVQARVVEDATRKVSKALADYAQVDDAAVQFQQQGDGGTFTVTAKPGTTPTKEGVEAALKPIGLDNPQATVNGRDITVKVDKLPPSPVQSVADALAKYAGTNTEGVNISTVGPTWGHEVSQKALKALLIFFLLLAIYLSLRFEWKMAGSAIVAVIHDVIFTIGFYALFQFQVSPATVTAFLTILGFSLYDTVVVFDKVLEFQRTLTATGRTTYGEMVNRSLNAVLLRSISTSLVALLPVLSLLIVGSGILGATALEDFALALAAGLFIGSYSSIFVASPLLAWWKEREPQYRALADRRRRVAAAAASASVGVPVVTPDEPADDERPDAKAVPIGVPGPPAVPRGPVVPRARQQRGKKRK
jgi:preprotein translocase subunit SecF